MQVILASNNQKKLGELSSLLNDLGLELIKQGALNIPEADETGTTFIENSIIKAKHACELSGLPAIADDSGLVVDALSGEPGVYSSRYAGNDASDEDNLAKVIQQLKQLNQQESSARFHCVISYMRNHQDPAPIICHGVWEGVIRIQRQGDKGFGYDPIFWLPEHHCTAAQMEQALKNQLSHRGQAMMQLITQLKQL